MTTLFTYIRQLAGIFPLGSGVQRGKAMANFPSIEDAYVLIRDKVIEDFGPMGQAPGTADRVIDCTGRMVLPTFVDSHTHIVYAGSREQEFVDRIAGLSYTEIAKRGGGILNSAKRLQDTPEDALFAQAMHRLHEVISFGTGAIEIKSGYGLSRDGELKMLRVIQAIKAQSPIPVKATFLGAHALPEAYKNNRQGYLDLLCEELIPQIAEEGLADYVDAFLEKDYFSVAETLRVVETGAHYGLKAKVHVNQFTAMGGVRALAAQGALSVDHLEVMEDDDYRALIESDTLPVVLPTCSFFIKIPYAPARTMIDRGMPVVLATDYNPGSTPGGKMPFAIALACNYMGLLPEEAFTAATINGAHAMEVADEVGSVAKGKRANFIITHPHTTLSFIPYAYSTDHIESVWINGERWVPPARFKL